jgi:hypothetical protein
MQFIEGAQGAKEQGDNANDRSDSVLSGMTCAIQESGDEGSSLCPYESLNLVQDLGLYRIPLPE